MMYFTPLSSLDIHPLLKFTDIFQPDRINVPLQNFSIDQPYTVMIYWLTNIFVLSFVLKLTKWFPNIRKAAVAALSIIVMVLACVVIYTYQPLGLQNFLAPLPFVEFEGSALCFGVYQINANGLPDIPAFCSQVLSMLVLSFLVNQIYNYDNANLKNAGWLGMRLVTTLFCILGYYGINLGLRFAIRLVPEGIGMELLRFVPIGVLFAILVLYVLGSIKIIMAKMLKMMNPTFEGLNGFFYKNKFGVMLNRAIWTTTILTIASCRLQYVLTQITPDASIALNRFPGFTGIFVLLLLFVIWIILGHSA